MLGKCSTPELDPQVFLRQDLPKVAQVGLELTLNTGRSQAYGHPVSAPRVVAIVDLHRHVQLI